MEALLHQLQLLSGTALVVVPGRAPVCLRCKRSGHLRRDCRVPRCDECRRFGHLKEDCVRTYVEVDDDEASYLRMDEDDAETAATGTDHATGGLSEAPTTGDEVVHVSQEKPAEEIKVLVPSVAETDTPAVYPAVELPRDAPAGETMTESGAMEANDQLPEPSCATATLEAASKVKSVKDSTTVPSNGDAKPKTKKDAKPVRQKTSSTASHESMDTTTAPASTPKMTLEQEASPKPCCC